MQLTPDQYNELDRFCVELEKMTDVELRELIASSRRQEAINRSVARLAELIREQKNQPKDYHLCVVCQINGVSPEEGYDTCSDCVRRI